MLLACSRITARPSCATRAFFCQSLYEVLSPVRRNMSTAAQMGLPKVLSEATIATIKATAPVVAPHARTITGTFYKNMLDENPDLYKFFNKSNQKTGMQPQTLANAVVAYATHIEDLSALAGFPGSPVDVMAHKHCALQVTPSDYQIVHDYLMAAVGEVLGDAITPEVGSAWSEAVLFLAGVLIDAEHDLYEAAALRSGGWRGFQPFRIVDIETLTECTKRFTFQPTDAADVNDGGFDFSPGQFISIRAHSGALLQAMRDNPAPRHYTIISKPGEDVLSCIIKRTEGGGFSHLFHTSAQVGEVIEISPPFGCFTARADTTKAVLVSGGIGVTPMIGLAADLGDKVALVAHLDRSPDTHACNSLFSALPKQYMYTANGDTLDEFIAQILLKVDSSHDVYLCGSPTFTAAASTLLNSSGMRVFTEALKGHSS